MTARYRRGLTVYEAEMDGRPVAIHAQTWIGEPEPDLPWNVWRLLRTLAAGTLIGLGAWLVTSGLLVVGGPS